MDKRLIRTSKNSLKVTALNRVNTSCSYTLDKMLGIAICFLTFRSQQVEESNKLKVPKNIFKRVSIAIGNPGRVCREIHEVHCRGIHVKLLRDE